jgi:hypothetical protein
MVMPLCYEKEYYYIYIYVKSKAIPVTGREGP